MRTAGLAAGVTEAVAVVTPMEVIKIRLQAQHHSMADPLDIPKYRNAAHALYTVVREEGVRALYRGVSLTALRQGSNQAGLCSFLFSLAFLFFFSLLFSFTSLPLCFPLLSSPSPCPSHSSSHPYSFFSPFVPSYRCSSIRTYRIGSMINHARTSTPSSQHGMRVFSGSEWSLREISCRA